MSVDQAFGNTQPQARSFARFFCREERLHNFIANLDGNAWAAVHNTEDDFIGSRLDRDSDPWITPILCRMHRVLQQVEQDL